MKKVLKVKISLLLTVVLVLVSVGGTWGITYYATKPNTQQALPSGEDTPKTIEKTTEELYAEAVKDAMTVESDEIQPLVSLEKGDPCAVYDNEGRVLMLTFHKYPDSYPDGKDVKLEWGEVWTFTSGELAEWYKENKDGVTDWPSRLRQLIGLAPDNEATHFTAMWVNPKDMVRPANVQDTGKVNMTASLAENTDESFKEWFDGNIVWSYFDSAYPWTRLGYTYDWADNGKEYGLSEFLVAKDSEVEVAYTVTTEKMLSMLEDGSWKPATVDTQKNAA